MSRTCVEAEQCCNYKSLYMAIRSSVMRHFGCLSSSESLASLAVKIAIDVNAALSAALIVILSEL